MPDQKYIENSVRSYLFDNHTFNELFNKNLVHIKGLHGSTKILFTFWLLEKRPCLIVMPDEPSGESLAEEAMAIMGDESVAFFPFSEDRSIPTSLNPRQSGMRMEVLRDLISEKLRLVITSASALLKPLPSPAQLQDLQIVLQPGIQTSLSDLLKHFIQFGYIREPIVERPGEICLRGGIIDIFPYTGEQPHRIEFFGNEIESIRTFDINTQRSTGESKELILVPSPDTWISSDCFLPDYFKTLPWIFIEDWDLALGNLHRDFEKQPLSTEQKQVLLKLDSFPIIHHHTLSSPKNTISFNVLLIPPMGRSPASIREQIKNWCCENQVFIICDPPTQVERMRDFLDHEDQHLTGLHIIPGKLRSGFQLPAASLIVLTQSDLFGHIHRRHPHKRFRVSAKPIREMSALNKGDFVVHIDYGIGLYQGLEKITVAEAERECLSIRYQDGDMLYVPIDKMERVQKYAGRESTIPELGKLGSSQWYKVKANTKKSVEKIAKELIRLYSIRQSQPGYAFSQDTPWQKELEASFVYEETPDQSHAIRDVKKDMEKPVPMDRLICGDVGYGKTEVAVRAAFKAVNDGKQVVVLVPTTILAQQHFQTFLERLASFPVDIEMLSRFRTKKAQSDIINRLKQGTLDIVIGTHRLFSKDVGFKNLGLLIIDEEQKFGVRHKERLKEFRRTVDVLTLSATPIPRTLNLSLVGIRDMSMINTPPRDRLPIHTEVLPFDESVVGEAIHRELNRQGQVFFVNNRIRSIHAVARMIERIVPGIRLAIAHGQMHEHDLEKVMIEFIEHKYDCLVATMIIGSGLDLPLVNTLLVNRADRLGLSQLYQLRGRVGRSNQKAYAYLFTPPLDLLNPDAIKRLRIIEEFTELGAGIQIAMKDLEIRGSGNLLGYQQSGYIDAVGFELYTKLVAETVEELKASETGLALKPSAPYCQAHINEDAYIPDSYIDDESLRVNLYRRLSGIQSESALNAFEKELCDRFGDPPESARNLLSLFQLQLIGKEKHIRQIRIEGHKIRLFFDSSFADLFETTDMLSQFLKHISELANVPVHFLTEHGLGIELSIPEHSGLMFTKKWLQSWS